jgi:uncharacterized protein (DUF58 family)
LGLDSSAFKAHDGFQQGFHLPLEDSMKRFVFLMLAVPALLSLTAKAADSGSRYTGWISDSMCGAKHAGTGSECVKKCIKEMGSAPVFVDEVQKVVWTIDNPEAVKAFYGDHVIITATADSTKKSVHIDSVVAAK